MVFSAAFFCAELVAVVVAEAPEVEVAGSVVDEQLAISTPTHAKSTAPRMGRTLPPLVLGTQWAGESITVASTASNMGLAHLC
jgi:hypothetical protein